MQRKADCRGTPLSCLDRFIFYKAWQNSRLIRLGQEFFVWYIRINANHGKRKYAKKSGLSRHSVVVP